MFDRSFFQTKLGKAALACTAAMCAFVAISTQFSLEPASVDAGAIPEMGVASFMIVELA